MNRLSNKIRKLLREAYLLIFIHKFPKFFRFSSFPYLSGDTLRSLADHIFDETQSMNPKNVKINDFVFVKADRLELYFSNIHKNIDNQYNLITHNSDRNIDEETALLIDDNILNWYAQNLITAEKNNIKIIPIGLENKRFLNNGLVSHFKKYHNSEKSEYIFCSFNERSSERASLNQLLKDNINVVQKNFKNHKEYTKNLAKFKFNLCPNGNGVDTHRIWESFMVNTIPIVKNQTFVRNLIKNNVPLFVVEEWDELIDIGKDELDNIYIDLIEKRNNLNVNDVDFWIKNII